MKRAFTLIELLVVIAIIGSLSAMLLPNFMCARERARDSQRKSDLKQIQKALEMYKQDQSPPAFLSQGAGNSFPISAGACWSSGSCSGNIYMNKFPDDPISENQYYYSVNNSALTYTICTCLENEADPDKASDCAVCSTCTTGPCYTVKEP